MTTKLYRVRKDCRLGDRKFATGEIISLKLREELARIAIEESECLAPVCGPPIGALPEFREVGGELVARCGIHKVEDLLVANSRIVAEKLRVDEQTVNEWKRLLERYIL